jgi:MFS family permease
MTHELLILSRYVYFAELFPNHLRNKGMTIGMAAISLMNIMWLQAAPTAFKNISWRFYLCFIIPAYLFAIVCWFFYPNTKGLALEEIAALFGDDVQQDVYPSTIQNASEVPNPDKDSQAASLEAKHLEKA